MNLTKQDYDVLKKGVEGTPEERPVQLKAGTIRKMLRRIDRNALQEEAAAVEANDAIPDGIETAATPTPPTVKK